MAAENDKKYVADTGLTQIEMGACVGAWVAIFTFFSLVDITDNIVFATLVMAGSQVAEKMPLLLGVGFLGGSLYMGYSYRASLTNTMSSALKKLMRFGRR